MFRRGGLSAASCILTSSRSASRYGSTQSSFKPVTIGHFLDTAKTSSETQCTFNDIVGIGGGGAATLSPVDSGAPVRLPAGECLGLMDICAAHTAMQHMRKAGISVGSIRPSASSSSSSSEPSSKKVGCATVACTDMAFRFPLVQGDMVHLTGTVVNCGKSSITVSVDVRRTQFPLKKQQCVASAFFHMVAIDNNLNAAKCVPAVILDTEEHYQAHLAATERVDKSRCKMKAELERYDPVRLLERLAQVNSEEELDTIANELSEIETTVNKSKISHMAFVNTVNSANRLFFPGHVNLNNTIFGGELLRWMEAHAVHCGRCFTRNKRVFSLGMHEVTFKKPLKLEDFVSLEAAVVYVKNTTLVVDVKLYVESAEDGDVTTNEASFVLTNFDEVGHLQPVELGLKLPQGKDEIKKLLVAAKNSRSSNDTSGSSSPPHTNGGGSHSSKSSKLEWNELDWLLKYGRAKVKYDHLYTQGRVGSMAESFRSVRMQ